MITRNRILFLLGALITLIPFLGFPSSYEDFFTTVFGLSIILLAFLYAREKHNRHTSVQTKREMNNDVYAENGPVSTYAHELNHSEIAETIGQR